MPPLWPLPERLAGLPVELSLGRSGEISGLANLDKLNERMFADLDEPPMWAQEARRVAAIVAAPLTFISPCQGTNLSVGVPDRDQRQEVSAGGELVTTIVTSHELQSLTRPDSARIVFTRVQGTRRSDSALDAPFLVGLNLRSDCIVDLHTGVALAGTYEMHGLADGEETLSMRSVVRVTPQ